MAKDQIIIKGARENNLKNIDVTLPRDKLIVMTGLSGSGKSSLAFDTIYADGQRRYMESLSSYARQFLGQMDKPDVDYIEGLSPAISIDQKTTSNNPRSTVGTVTEIYDYLRLLWARVGVPHCPVCGREIRQQTVDQIVDSILSLPGEARFQVLAPVVRERKGEHRKELESARKSGFARVRVDGSLYDLEDTIELDKNKKHTVELVVDRLVNSGDIVSRLTDSVETALKLAEGLVRIDAFENGETLYSQSYSCPEHGISIEELTPRMFSFNNPAGACPKCSGLGTFLRIDPDLIIPDPSKSLRQGAVTAPGWGTGDGTIAMMYYTALAEHYGFSLDTPVKELPAKAYRALLYGTGKEKLQLQRRNEFGFGSFTSEFEGIVTNLERRYNETNSDWARSELTSYMSAVPCPDCHGQRLNPVALAVTVGGRGIMEVCAMPIEKAAVFFEELQLSDHDRQIADRILKEVRSRLAFLINVGLGYLDLRRAAGTLSGGESQRIRLATQIGSSLVGVLYVLDEPSIGLHQRDNQKLIASLKRLRDLGNTLIVVEHDEETIRSADYIVDIGPFAGVHGGELVACGSVDDIIAAPRSLTGKYLSGELKIEVPAVRRAGNGRFLEIRHARRNNLKDIDVAFPLGAFCCVTGVSGSGKSSLVNDILYKTLSIRLNRAKGRPNIEGEVLGLEYLDKVIGIDQSPIGRTPRSNPATYIGLFTAIREVFAETNAAKMRGYGPGRFSFNVKGGRCEACEGDGVVKIEMHFLPDIYVPCEVCKGRRFNRETLEVRFKDKTIYDVLEMTVDEGLEFFRNQPRIFAKLRTLADVGLGYIKIGQSSTTLSGGEAQRVKLAAELSRTSTGRTVYILDEPTTGLHSYDVHRLIGVLQRLVEAGNTVIVIEHNLDVIKTADYVLDLGPEGGDGGGFVVAAGTPEQVAACESSYTGQYLQPLLK